MRGDAGVPVSVPGGSATGSSSRHRLLEAATALEVTLAVVAVVLDLLVPTLVLLAMTIVSIAVRRQPLASLGLHRPAHARLMVAQVLALSLLWTALTSGLFMPVVEHLSGQRQDLGVFADVEGNLALLGVLLIASWTLAAIGEEVAYRGYLLTRVRQLLPAGALGSLVAVAAVSLLFGLAHTEQGLVGVVLASLDAAYFASLRYRFATVWASVLAHGFNNTIGLLTFFVVGSVHGLW